MLALMHSSQSDCGRCPCRCPLLFAPEPLPEGHHLLERFPFRSHGRVEHPGSHSRPPPGAGPHAHTSGSPNAGQPLANGVRQMQGVEGGS